MLATPFESLLRFLARTAPRDNCRVRRSEGAAFPFRRTHNKFALPMKGNGKEVLLAVKSDLMQRR